MDNKVSEKAIWEGAITPDNDTQSMSSPDYHRRDFCRVLYLQPYFAKLAAILIRICRIKKILF
jgi:hypothetical protein